MAQENQVSLNALKRRREKINWEMEDERREFYSQFHRLIVDWRGQLPNLRDILWPEAIEWLLAESVRSKKMDPAPFVKFVINTGYKDEPDLNEDGKSILRRTTALHHAAKRWFYFRDISVGITLFKIYDKFDVNYVDEDGYTHFHIACKYGYVNAVKKFLDLGQDPNLLVEKTGDSPLLLALANHRKDVAMLLLRNDANLILANKDGSTPLHLISKIDFDDGLTEMFFELNDELQQTVQIDARDNEGNTPLHLATSYGNAKMVESLLRRGADPCSANATGLTPLHSICQRARKDYLLELFFELNDQLQQTLQIDARDKLGQTPLQLAVTHFSLDKVDVLLDRGADLSEFSFPTESLFNHVYKSLYASSKVQLASEVLRVVEHLKEKGYELDRNEVLTIAASFSEYGLFEKSVDLDESWYDDNKFVKKAKNIMIIKPDLSLYDLTRLRPEETKKLLAKKEYITFVCSQKLNGLLTRHRSPCALHLCEKISREFFRRWALDSFLELIGYKLPILCSEMIIKWLKNEDLCNICLSVNVSL